MVVDIIVAIILFGSAIISFLRGFIREILTIFGIVGGMIAAYIGGPMLVPHMSIWLGIVEGEEPKKLFDVVPYDMLAQGLSYFSVFLGFAVVLSIISHLLSEGASKIGLGALDRTLGVVFGLVRGLLVLGLLYMPFMFMTQEESRDQWFAESKTHPYIEATSTWLAQFIPKEATDKMQQGLEQAQQANETRQKLQDMGMLPGQQPTDGLAQQQTKTLGQEGAQPPVNSGYSPEFRNQMNQLIDNTTQQQQVPGQQQPSQPVARPQQPSGQSPSE